MNKAKIQTMIGFAVKAGNCAFGAKASEEMKKRKNTLALIDESASANTKEKLTNRCKFYQIPYLLLEPDLLGDAAGKENAKVALILDSGIAKQILEYYNN